MLSIEQTEAIKHAYQRKGFDELDDQFYLKANFDELKEGDLVFFPFNVRLGVYRVETMDYYPYGIKGINGLYRNSTICPLLPIRENQGVVLCKVPEGLVNWDDWEDIEMLISLDMTEGHRIAWHKMDGFSNWYDAINWETFFPKTLLTHIESDWSVIFNH